MTNLKRFLPLSLNYLGILFTSIFTTLSNIYKLTYHIHKDPVCWPRWWQSETSCPIWSRICHCKWTKSGSSRAEKSASPTTTQTFAHAATRWAGAWTAADSSASKAGNHLLATDSWPSSRRSRTQIWITLLCESL